MGVFSYEHEHTSTLPPAKLYKAFTKDSDDLIPKAVEPIQSVENVEGTGGPGTIKKLTILHGMHILKFQSTISLHDIGNLHKIKSNLDHSNIINNSVNQGLNSKYL